MAHRVDKPGNFVLVPKFVRSVRSSEYFAQTKEHLAVVNTYTCVTVTDVTITSQL